MVAVAAVVVAFVAVRVVVVAAAAAVALAVAVVVDVAAAVADYVAFEAADDEWRPVAAGCERKTHHWAASTSGSRVDSENCPTSALSSLLPCFGQCG